MGLTQGRHQTTAKVEPHHQTNQTPHMGRNKTAVTATGIALMSRLSPTDWIGYKTGRNSDITVCDRKGSS